MLRRVPFNRWHFGAPFLMSCFHEYRRRNAFRFMGVTWGGGRAATPKWQGMPNKGPLRAGDFWPAMKRAARSWRWIGRLSNVRFKRGHSSAPVASAQKRDPCAHFEIVASFNPSLLRITVWLEVRILPGPPGSRPIAEISWRLANSPELAGLSCSRLVSGQVHLSLRRHFGPLSLALKNTFPGNGDLCCRRRGSNATPPVPSHGLRSS
jgi:hypothetical protein